MQLDHFRIPLGSAIEDGIDLLSDHLAPLTKAMSNGRDTKAQYRHLVRQNGTCT